MTCQHGRPDGYMCPHCHVVASAQDIAAAEARGAAREREAVVALIDEREMALQERINANLDSGDMSDTLTRILVRVRDEFETLRSRIARGDHTPEKGSK